MVRKYTISLILSVLIINCNKQSSISLKTVFVAKGESSWYGPGFQGEKTASGEKFDMNALTAAHKQLEFGTFVRVKNIANDKEVIVKINDRGPISKKRIIDLSKKAAENIDLVKKGAAKVKLEISGYDIVNQITFLKHYRNILKIKQAKNNE
jgi:rare lipoprotein A